MAIHYIALDIHCGFSEMAVVTGAAKLLRRDQVQYHILTFLGESWCRGERPKWPDEKIIELTRRVVEKGGVVTYDVPIQKSGLIPEPFIDQLRAIGKAMK